MASQRDRVIAQLRKRQEEKLLKKESDSLKAKRTYAEEVSKTQPEYKATKAKEEEAKRIKADTNLKKAKQEAKPESGTEAIDRLLEAIKTAKGKVVPGDKPIHTQDFPKDIGYEEWMTSGMRVNPTKAGYREYLGTPKPGTASEIGLDRVKELKDELQTAKYAKDEDVSFKEAQQSAPVRKAYKSKIDELVKMFNQPGVDPRKVRYLIKLQSQEWLKRNYPAYSNK